MCPDPQLISIFLDGELPSPWSEKMEGHLKGCSACKEKLENFKRLHELFRKDTSMRRTFVERIDEPSGSQETVETSKDRVWRKLESRQRFKTRNGLMQRKLSIPLPAAAAAAVIIALLTALWFRDGRIKKMDISERGNFILAEEEEMPGIIPAADINGVLQYLTSDGTDVIILRLPESRNFSRTGEPAIIRAADYPRRQP